MEIINVVEVIGQGNMKVNSFVIIENSVRTDKNTKRKIKAAEDLFVKLAQENGMVDDDIEYCLDSGYYELEDYHLYLIWSE